MEARIRKMKYFVIFVIVLCIGFVVLLAELSRNAEVQYGCRILIESKKSETPKEFVMRCRKEIK